MAKVKCNYCGHFISDKVDTCPKCGAINRACTSHTENFSQLEFSDFQHQNSPSQKYNSPSQNVYTPFSNKQPSAPPRILKIIISFFIVSMIIEMLFVIGITLFSFLI